MIRSILFALLMTVSTCIAAQGLRVGMSADYPPMAYREDGDIIGIEADNALAVGKMLNQKMTLVELPFKELIPALREGKIDVIMSGLSITLERGDIVTFTDPYMKIGQMAITHRDKIARYAKPWSVYQEGVRIGVEPDTTGAEFARQELVDANIVFFADSEAAFKGLRDDKIDLYIHDAPTSWRLATSTQNGDLISLYAPLTNEELAWAVRKEDGLLAQELNSALKTMKANGTLRYILNRWIPVTVEVN